MAREAQFASLDGTVSSCEDNDFTPHPNAIARRSISIFSRRGTETPEPKPTFIAQAAMGIPKQLTERQKSWIKRKSCPVSSSHKRPKTTILNAVPAAKTIRMTPLEEEMATSPNEEIMSAVSASGSPGSPTQQVNSFWDKRSISPTQQTQSARRSSSNARIGVWVDGIAHWDAEARQERIGWEEPSLPEQIGFTPLLPNSAAGLSEMQTKPNLSIVIPGDEPLVNDITVSTTVQPMPRRPVVSVAPASIVTKFASSTPTRSVWGSFDISPLDSVSRSATPPSVRPKAPRQADLVVETTPTKDSRRPSPSSSSSSLTERASSSVYSQRSSATSVEAVAASAVTEPSDIVSSVEQATVENVLDCELASGPNLNKPLPPSPIPLPRRVAPARPSSTTSTLSRSGSIHGRSASTKSTPDGERQVELRRMRHVRAARSLSGLEQINQAFMRSSPYFSDVADPESPTLSEAAKDMEAHLTTVAEYSRKSEETTETTSNDELTVAPSVTGSVRRSDSIGSVERVPSIPKRSRKRDWRISSNAGCTPPIFKPQSPRRMRSELTVRHPPTGAGNSEVVRLLRKTESAATLSKVFELVQMTKENRPPLPRIVIGDGLIAVHGPVVIRGGIEQDELVSSDSAEEVLLHILAALTSLGDLSNTALINRGMHRVYKENEMNLVRTVTYNQSPAAWELREWCPLVQINDVQSSKASIQLEHTPKSYTHCYNRDLDVIESLKALILQRCQTFIRRETTFALSTPSHPHAQRFDDAFWRIWCFCKIFGSAKNREEDVTGQLDWLKGGLLANNQDLTATMNMNLEFDMSSVLLNAPDFFAKGNASGLSAQQLYDITEIWSCLTTILSGYHGRADQAREYGIFENYGTAQGDIESEEEALEEWTAYLLTLGPTVVLEMAQCAYDPSPAGFALAELNGWTQWSMLNSGGTRTTFLKEPVARLYEERVAAAAVKLQNPHEREKKELSRKRVANLAAEIKLARQASGYRRLPLIDMNTERPMSVLSRRGSAASSSPFHGQSRAAARRSKYLRQPPNFSVPQPKSPPTDLFHTRKISPIIEDRVETFNRMSLQNFACGVAEDTSDRAVRLIADMGFSETQAREALRMTDLGDGLRVDRAVDMLLRQ